MLSGPSWATTHNANKEQVALSCKAKALWVCQIQASVQVPHLLHSHPGVVQVFGGKEERVTEPGKEMLWMPNTCLSVSVDKMESIAHIAWWRYWCSLLYQTCIKTQELQSLFLRSSVMVQEGLFTDESLGYVARLRAVLIAPGQPCSKCWGECFWPPLMPSSSVNHNVTPDHLILSFMAVLLNLTPPSLLPQVYFSAYAETKAACL